MYENGRGRKTFVTWGIKTVGRKTKEGNFTE